MKKLIIALLVIAMAAVAMADDPDSGKITPNDDGTYTIDLKAKPKCSYLKYLKAKSVSVKDCQMCHVAGDGFPALKETAPSEKYSLPTYHARIVNGRAHYRFESVDYEHVDDFFNWLTWHKEINHVVFDIFSPGGSVMDAWHIISLFRMAESRGVVIETRVHGIAASAAFLITVAGTKGHRYAAKNAELMCHELWTFKIFDVATPSDKEDEAKILRHMQDNISRFLAERSNMPKDEIDNRIKRHDWWMWGDQALEHGFIDALLPMESEG